MKSIFELSRPAKANSFISLALSWFKETGTPFESYMSLPYLWDTDPGPFSFHNSISVYGTAPQQFGKGKLEKGKRDLAIPDLSNAALVSGQNTIF